MSCCSSMGQLCFTDRHIVLIWDFCISLFCILDFFCKLSGGSFDNHRISFLFFTKSLTYFSQSHYTRVFSAILLLHFFITICFVFKLNFSLFSNTFWYSDDIGSIFAFGYWKFEIGHHFSFPVSCIFNHFFTLISAMYLFCVCRV